MPEDKVYSSALIIGLNNLKSDTHLSRVISSKSPNECLFKLWLLEITERESKNYKVLYGQVIPSTYKDSSKWSISDGGKSRDISKDLSLKVRTPCLKLYASNSKILELVIELCKGLSLNQACQSIGLETVDHLYGDLTIGVSESEINNNFVVRPTVILETKEVIGKIKHYQKPMGSPVNAPTFCGSLFRLNKSDIWKTPYVENQELSNKLARYCLEKMSGNTGYKFKGADSPRFEAVSQ